MAEEQGNKKDAFPKTFTFPLVQKSDMNEEMKAEVMELCVTACEKFANNNELAAKMIKDLLEKKFGPPWHVCIGEGFGFMISYHKSKLLFMHFGGNVGVLVWKFS